MATYTEACEYDFPKQSNAEELANTVTHGMGAALSLVGTAVLVAISIRNGSSSLQLLATVLYGLSLVAVYAASTLSHGIQEPRRKHLFRVLDQAVIYCLIAGTYTPFIFMYVPGKQGWLLFAVVWGLAIFGFYSKAMMKHRIEAVAVINYILLGWVPAAAMLYVIPSDCLLWMFIGGCLYTIGALFLTFDQHVPFFHTTWHGFVLVASAVHFFAVMEYTIA